MTNRNLCSCKASQGLAPITESCGECCGCLERQAKHTIINMEKELVEMKKDLSKLKGYLDSVIKTNLTKKEAS